jgi:hypothetical protein
MRLLAAKDMAGEKQRQQEEVIWPEKSRLNRVAICLFVI